MGRIKYLNFGWHYTPQFEQRYISGACSGPEFVEVNIPHTNVILPYNNLDERSYQIESCYVKSLVIPADEKGNRVFIHFDGIMTYAKVYMNGTCVGEHKGGYTPFKIDISDYVTFGMENQLVVYVDSRERKEIPPFGFVVDYLTYGGIYREVYLEYASHIKLNNCLIKTTRVLEGKKFLDLDIYVDNNNLEERKIRVKTTLMKDSDVIKNMIAEIQLTSKPDQVYSLHNEVEDVLLWDVDHPELYDLVIQLESEGVVHDTCHYRFGFREVDFRGDGFYLNGKNIKLRGLNRHQSYPYVGYAMPRSAQYKDADILKNELGVNMVRLSHYPQSDHFLNRCDELGLLVFDEIPGWQHIGDEGEWWEITKQHTRDMIMKDWNHPSIVIWGTRINESQDCDALYERTNHIAKSLDVTRPTGGVRCTKGSRLYEDVYTYNDFIYDGKHAPLNTRKKVAKQAVPYLVTEHNGHMFPTKKFDDVSHRVEHARRHLEVLNATYKDKEIAGSIGWCMFDYNTHQEFGSGDKICYHGVLDMFRIPKYAASVYMSQQDHTPVMEIAHSMENGDMEGSVRGDVMVFTNCDYMKMYINDAYIKTFYPRKDLYPYIPNPPIIINDFIGNLIEENERFTKKDGALIKNLLMKVNRIGEKLPLLDKIKLGYLFLKYRMNMKDGVDLYTKYFGGWGTASTNYRFEGYIDDSCVMTKVKSQVFQPSLIVALDESTLRERHTYDVTRVIVRMVDEQGDDLYYAHDAISIETDGPIDIIGPKTIALMGGSVGFWIKSTGKAGEGIIKITSPRFGEIRKTVLVIKEDENNL